MTESDSTTKIAVLPARIEAEHLAAIGSVKNAIEHAIRCGRLLAQAKAAVPHGEWANWVSGNLSFGLRQAQKYIYLAVHANPDANANSKFASIDQALRVRTTWTRRGTPSQLIARWRLTPPT